MACSHSGQSHGTWTSSSCAAPQWGHAVLVRVPWPDTVAAAGHEAAQQQNLQIGGGGTQRPAAGRAICPIAQPPKGDRAPCLKLARGVAAKAILHPVLDLAEGLLHEVQRVLFSRDAPAPTALALSPPQGGLVWSARPTGPVPGGRPPDFQMAGVKTWVTPER